MGKNFKHVDKGKYRNKVLKYDDVCDSTKNMFERHNSDISEDKQELFRIKNKIAEKELKEEIRIIETFENIDFDILEQDRILEQIMGRR